MREYAECINNEDYEDFFKVGMYYAVEEVVVEDSEEEFVDVFLEDGDIVSCLKSRFRVEDTWVEEEPSIDEEWNLEQIGKEVVRLRELSQKNTDSLLTIAKPCNPKVMVHRKVCEKIWKSSEGFPSIPEQIFEMYLDLKQAKQGQNKNKIKMRLIELASYCVSLLADCVKTEKDVCESMTDLYERKNHDYGDSFMQMRKEYPDAILIRVYDKYSRLKTLLGGSEAKVKDESIKDTIFDLANYCIMELVEMEIEDGNKAE